MASEMDVVARKFRMLDTDGSGVIEETEFRSFLCNISERTFSQDNISALFVASDTNKDGQIQVEEFLNFILREPSNPALPSSLMAKFKAALEQIPIPKIIDSRSSSAEMDAKIKQLRKDYGLENIPDWLETLVVQYHLKHTPLSSGDHNLKLIRIAPSILDGSPSLLCLLGDIGTCSNCGYLYALRASKFARLESKELCQLEQKLDEIEAALPKEVRLLCRLYLGSGGRQICSYSQAIEVLRKLDVIDVATLENFVLVLRQDTNFTTLEELILEIMGDDTDEEAISYLAEAKADPDAVWSQLSACIGQDARQLCGEPQLSIDWIVAQVFP